MFESTNYELILGDCIGTLPTIPLYNLCVIHEDMMKDFRGNVEAGELCVLEKSNNRLIPLANTAVWTQK